MTGDSGEHILRNGGSRACQTLITPTEPGNERLNPSFGTHFLLSKMWDELREILPANLINLASSPFISRIDF